MNYRLYRRDPVKARGWYLSVTCKGCGRTIPLLDDLSGGKSPVKLMGDGLLSTGCLQCGHDDTYKTKEVTSIQAEEDLAGGRPERISTDPSSRKPLMRSYSSSKAIFGVGYIEDRPKSAAIVGRIITSWADIEVECARLLAEMMDINIPTSAALFSSLRSSRSQHDALDAVAKIVLDTNDYELYNAYMTRRAALEKERNDLTHGCYGVSITIPDGIVWVSQADFIQFTAEVNQVATAAEEFRKKQFVYENGTLERIAQEIAELYEQLGLFRGYLWARRDTVNGQGFRAQQYIQLCSQPHIRQALDRIRTARKASQSQQPRRCVKRDRKQ